MKDRVQWVDSAEVDSARRSFNNHIMHLPQLQTHDIGHSVQATGEGLKLAPVIGFSQDAQASYSMFVHSVQEPQSVVYVLRFDSKPQGHVSGAMQTHLDHV